MNEKSFNARCIFIGNLIVGKIASTRLAESAVVGAFTARADDCEGFAVIGDAVSAINDECWDIRIIGFEYRWN